MGKSEVSSSSRNFQVLSEQKMTDEVKEIAETIVEEDISKDLTDERQTVKEEVVDFYGTGEYFNKPAFEIKENKYTSESNYDRCVIKVEQNEGDCGDEFINIGTSQNEADITKRESPVHCKEEDLDIKYEDLKTELTDWRHKDENERGETRQKLEIREREESPIKSKQAGNRGHNLSLIHKAKSEIYLHKCEACSYAAQFAVHLKRHMLVHKSKSEVNLYKCLECSYAGKRARDLKMHMLLHKAKTEVDLYKCRECAYESKRAGNLKNHMLVHKAKSEIDLYKCHECSYAGKRSGDLKRHILSHKAESGVNLYKCHECSYATKQAWNLKGHMLVHEAKSEVYLHKCENCSYASKCVRSLKKHMSVHGVKPEVDECSYEAKQSRELQTKPILVHIAKLEVNLYNVTYFLGESRESTL